MNIQIGKTVLSDEEWFDVCRSVAARYYRENQLLTNKLVERLPNNALLKLDAEDRNQVRILLDIADGIIERHNGKMKAQCTKIEGLRYHRTWYKSAYFKGINLNLNRVKELAEAGLTGWDIFNQMFLKP